MTESKSFVFRVGDVEVREREFTVIKAGEVLQVEPKIFRLLVYLLHNPQRLTTKEELLDAVWGDAVVSESSLTRAIALLRRLLGDEIRNPRYIETVATVGYRLMCKVEILEDRLGTPELAAVTNGSVVEPPANLPAPLIEESSEGAKTGTRKNTARSRLGLWLIPAAALLALTLTTPWYLLRPMPPPRITGYTQITHDGHDKVLGGTDGDRLYITEMSEHSIAQIVLADGQTAQIPVPVPNPRLVDVSPDGSRLLIASDGADSNGAVAFFIVPVLGGTPRLLCNAVDAVWSPDGKFVIYTTPEGDIDEINGNGSGAHKIVSSGGLVTRPASSPDGQTIRFTKGNMLWEVSSSGKNIRPLLPNWQERSAQCCGRWTPDGRYFVFLAATDGSFFRQSEIWALDERHELLSEPSKQPFRLAAGPIRWGKPIPARDGSRVFSKGNIWRGELVRVDTRSGKVEPYLSGISAEFISYSADGKFVAYTTFPEGILWKANRDGSNPVKLTDTPIYAVAPHWSPDGSQILFTDLPPAGGAKNYLIASGGGSIRSLMSSRDLEASNPGWSPDGARVVFSAAHPGGREADRAIYILDLATEHTAPIAGSVGMTQPQWSPNGKYIAALSSDSLSLRIFDIAGKRWTALNTGRPAEFLNWSPDGQFLYFLSNQGDRGVFRIHASGGKAERVFDLSAWHLTGTETAWMGLDPEGAPLLLRDAGGGDIYDLSLMRN